MKEKILCISENTETSYPLRFHIPSEFKYFYFPDMKRNSKVAFWKRFCKFVFHRNVRSIMKLSIGKC